MLNYNLRTGFVTTNTAALDTQHTNYPYIEPVSFGLSATNFKTVLMIPATWLSSNLLLSGPDSSLKIEVLDIWKNKSTLAFPVPRIRTQMNIQNASNQTILLNWTAVPGQVYHIEESTNLVDWTTLPNGTSTAGVDQILLELPYAPTNGDPGFFRTVID